MFLPHFLCSTFALSTALFLRLRPPSRDKNLAAPDLVGHPDLVEVDGVFGLASVDASPKPGGPRVARPDDDRRQRKAM